MPRTLVTRGSTPHRRRAALRPGREVGTIGSAALPAPNSLLIIVGHTAGELSRVPGAERVSSIQSTVPSSCNGRDCEVRVGLNTNAIDLILSVVACALLFPVLIFIGTATRLSAARREQRFAAMRLVGATPRQISVISAVESTVAAAAGVGIGFGLFFLLRSPMAAIPFTGAPFFPGDLSLSLADILLVAAGVPVAAAVAARLACFVVIGRPRTTPGQIAAYLPGFLLIVAGLVIAGPWLTMVGARLMARRTSRSATLIAARRLSDDPRAGFRAISGLVLALFVTTVAVGVITAVGANRGATSLGKAANGTLVVQLAGPDSASAGTAIPGALTARLRSIQGVRGVTLLHVNPLGATIPGAMLGIPSSFGPVRAGLVSCAQLARTPALGRCPAGALAAAVPWTVLPPDFTRREVQAGMAWPDVAISAQRLQRLPVESVIVNTNGSAVATEQARTTLENAYPTVSAPAAIGEMFSHNSDLTGWQQLANVVVLTSLAIAGCTLAASVAAGVSERKRPFSLLRLAGAPLGMLRRIVAMESVVPLLAVAVVSTGTGFLAAQLFLTSQMNYSLVAPGGWYYTLVAAGLVASLGIIAATLPLLNRITGPETARNE